ncbi:uncharacterized protein LTR77_009500 [Saxophila tyrrhenica]|uniref:SSD domain-containing protein n=1 Tax=Saxophila tyrrhenica TaxID=1690608 RepID=A0AAV9NY11_9PEZI|nr:hypothetical protein LTR77_009500 [Saxophila tyrrhenica]
MIWYLLYPLRGTTQPPRLSSNHPIRRGFYRHGRTTAQHWLVTMLVSVAIAMGFSYPTILLAENPTAGFATFPHHVWTTAKPLEGNPNRADVEMRQVWVHGSYMKALDKGVLNNALDIQQSLVGGEPLTSNQVPSLHDKLRSSTLDWGYHSPLMYWNNSHETIDEDGDILQTINDKARSTSSLLNVALRPASVFAGKKFQRSKLIAADALVITLMNKVQDGIGAQWRKRMSSLTSSCTLFPRDGQVTRNKVYEFSIIPLSLKENFALSIAYCCMALYVLLSLRRIKAFHSRFGLVYTAITQMTCSIMSSFTICGILKINLSMIPQNAYPFVVLVLGIENMFRLINAVVAYPPTMATELRLANALGDIGPVIVATAVQNLIMLALLSRVVSPGVAAFCVFACIAALFDVFFLLTFFIAVLNVDIRRFELQDALARANQSRPRRKPSPVHHHTWFDALVHGRLPFSTRMAGTAVTTTFILSLNYHFFEQKEKATSLRHLLQLIKNGPPMLDEFDSFAPPPINASLTPGQWMRMQDFDTAKEVMRLAKPGADSFIVRVFSPLIVVLPGADRTDVDEEEAWSSAFRSFAVGHFYPVAVAVVFIVAFVAVLMNFLLYTDHEEDELRMDGEEEQDAVKVGSVALPHKLDIIKMFTSQKGALVTIGLDRTIAITTLDASQRAQRIMCFSGEALSTIQWPIYSTAVDDNCEWIACHCADDRILLYSCVKASFVNPSIDYPDDNPPVLFKFVRLPSLEGSQLHFLALTSGGRLATTNVDTGTSAVKRLEHSSLLGAAMQEMSTQGRRLVVFTDQAQIIAYSWIDGRWTQTVTQSLPVRTTYGRLTGRVRLEQTAELGSEVCVVITSRDVLFLDAQTFATLSQVNVDDHDPSLAGFMLGQGKQCASCGSPALRSMALVTEGISEYERSVVTLSATTGKDAALCLKAGDASCNPVRTAQRTTQKVENTGAWSIVNSQAVLGLRKQHHEQFNGAAPPRPSVRSRRTKRSKPQSEEIDLAWEAYRLSIDGSLDAVQVLASDSTDAGPDNSLYVSNAGPAVAIDGQTIAVAFGNTVKVITSTRRGSMVRRATGRTFERQQQPEVMKDSSAILTRPP